LSGRALIPIVGAMLRATLASILLVALALFGFGAELGHALPAGARDSDTQSAKRSLLTLHDFPKGWVQDKSLDIAVKCPAFTAARRDASGVGISPRFGDGLFLEAESSVYRYADEAAAERALRAMTGRATQRCYIDGVTKALKDGDATEVRTVRVQPLLLRRVGDERAGTRFVFPVTAAGIKLDVRIDLTYVRSGRALSLVFCLGGGNTFSRRLRQALIATQAGRLAA
jgi:hypothetical protein